MDWDQLADVVQQRNQDPDRLRLNILDLLKMVDVQRTLKYIELGWHLSALQNHILPGIDRIDSLNRDYSQAFQALQDRTQSLSTYVNLPFQRSQDPVVRLRNRYAKALTAHKGYAVIAEAYCRNPIPLMARKPDEVVNVNIRCIISNNKCSASTK